MIEFLCVRFKDDSKVISPSDESIGCVRAGDVEIYIEE